MSLLQVYQTEKDTDKAFIKAFAPQNPNYQLKIFLQKTQPMLGMRRNKFYPMVDSELVNQSKVENNEYPSFPSPTLQQSSGKIIFAKVNLLLILILFQLFQF